MALSLFEQRRERKREVKEILRRVPSITTVSIVLFALLLFAPAAVSAPEAGDRLPGFMLAAPDDPAGREYLGITGRESFSVADIRADVVLIEFFNIYCPHCQADAPVTRELYRLVQADPRLADRVRLIGIGIGNTDFEVGLFKKKYAVPFPLFADGDYAIEDTVQIRYTPHYVAVRLDGEGGARVVYSQIGRIGDPKDFIETLSRL
jgi:thiol-disulfide isomerase/thioredoxin